MRLTVKQRILLHLLEQGRYAEALEVPKAMTQEGIAAAAWIQHRHVSQYLRPLIRDGLIRERKAHVEGIRQRRKVYELTEHGKGSAIRLREKVKSESVRVRDAEEVREASIAQILSEGKGRATVLDVARLAAKGEPIRLAELTPPRQPSFVEMLSDAPKTKDFVGRRDELEAITRDSDKPRLFVVRGVAGIGKSSLGAQACEVLQGTRNLFWHRVRPWDTLPSILVEVGDFLAALEKPGLRSVLMRGETAQAAQVLREDLPGTNSFLIFDDAHAAKPDVQPFFRLLAEAIANAPDVRALILTRRGLSFYDRRDVVLEGLVQEFDLPGLESLEVVTYLEDGWGRAVTSLPLGRRALGHPLLLELVRARRTVPARAIRDVRRFIEEEIYGELPDAERKMMGVASLYEVPVPREALFADPSWSHNVLLALVDRSLIRPVGAQGFEAHDTIRDFFSDVLTQSERPELGDFAVGHLRALASQAKDAGNFPVCASYLSNALQLSKPTAERAALWETLGDTNERVGDVAALSVAYREAMKLTTEPEVLARLRRKLASALQRREEMDSAIREVEAGFQALGDTASAERGWLELVRSRLLFDRAWKKGREHAEAALETFREFDDLRGQAEALLELAWVAALRGEGLALAVRRLQDALDIANRLDDNDLIAKVHLATPDLGDVEQVERHFAAIQAMPQAMQNPLTRLRVVLQRAWFNYTIKNDPSAARADSEEALRLATQNRDAPGVIMAKAYLAHIAIQEGRISEARRGFDEAAEGSLRLGYQVPWILSRLAECYLMEGDLGGFNRTFAAFKKRDTGRPYEGWLEYGALLRGFDQLIKGNGEKSISSFKEAVRVAETLPTDSILFGAVAPFVRLDVGVALRVMGDDQEGAEHIRTAQEIYQARNMKGALAIAAVKESQLEEGLQRMLRT